MNPEIALLFSALLLLALFFGTWLLSRRENNYSFVDVTWSLSFAPVALLYSLTGHGWAPRRWAVGVLVAGWSLRLGTYLWRRVAAHHPEEDPRYAALREGWKGNLPTAFLWFFLAQGGLVWLLTLPVYLVCAHRTPALNPWEVSGLILWLGALMGEAVADVQLQYFKAKRLDRSAVCQVGLWRYSRHPNYFFQALLWWGLFLMALPAPWGWCAILAPLAMLFFLLRVTGIPLTEQLAVASKGEAYRTYQATTSAFVPLPPRSAASKSAP